MSNLENSNFSNRTPFIYKSPVNIVWDIDGFICENIYTRKLSHEELIIIAKEIIESDIVSVKILCSYVEYEIEILIKLLYMLAENKIITTLQTKGFIINKNLINAILESRTTIELKLYGGSSETHDKEVGEEGNFHRIIDLIKLSGENNINVKLNFYITNDNYYEFERIIDLAHSIGKVTTIQGYIDTAGLLTGEKYSNLSIEARQAISEMLSKKLNESLNIGSILLKDSLALLRKMVRAKNATTDVYINSCGDVLAHKRLPKVFGNLKNMKLKEVWDSELNSYWKLESTEKLLHELRNRK